MAWNTESDAVRKLINGRRATTIAETVDIMTALDGTLPDVDGLKWFNRLYLQVTLAVRDAVTTTTFRDPAFLATLDVVFANLYFDAVAAGESDPASAPSAWRPLFECRHRQGIRPIQFALAGMNAHINRDLPEGIVATYRATDGAPVQGSERHEDFEKVNDLLEAVETQIKAEFSTGLVMIVDVACGDMDDAMAMWKVRAARAAAWTNAEVLWALRSTPTLRQRFFSRLDSFTGFAGRGLLVPTARLPNGKRGAYADD
jgi:hypothetical protein